MEQLTFTPSELRVTPEGRTVVGIAVPYGEPGIGPKGPEVVRPGAFTRTLEHLAGSGRHLKAFRHHDHANPVGTIDTLTDSPDGLRIEVRMADTTAGEEALREVRAGMLDSFSIGFNAKRETFAGGLRNLLELALLEVSLVAMPAYAGARVTEVRDAPKADLSRYLPPELPADIADWC
jgi:HK97 family phage prohead protease